MTVKSILCLYSGEPSEDSALQAAMGLAAAFSAEVRYLRIVAPLSAYTELAGALAFGHTDIEAPLMAAIRQERGAPADVCAAKVAACANAYGVALTTATGIGPRAAFGSVTANLRDGLAAEGRCFDLIVMGRAEPEASSDWRAAVAAVEATGLPVLVVPRRDPDAPAPVWPARRVAIAWDGSRAAARAMRDALPLMQAAQHVEVICVEAHAEAMPSVAAAPILSWLALHGLAAEVTRVGHVDSTVAEAIIARADAVHADLLVMGTSGLDLAPMGRVTKQVLRSTRLPLLASA